MYRIIRYAGHQFSGQSSTHTGPEWRMHATGVLTVLQIFVYLLAKVLLSGVASFKLINCSTKGSRTSGVPLDRRDVCRRVFYAVLVFNSPPVGKVDTS